MELYEDSTGSYEYSTGSTLLPHSTGDNLEHSLHQDIGTGLNIQIGDQKGVGGCDQGGFFLVQLWIKVRRSSVHLFKLPVCLDP